jgi:hypothetical protein
VTITRPDYTAPEDEEIVLWVDTVIPERLTSLNDGVTTQTDRLAVVQISEDIFKKTYDSFALVMQDGYFEEIAGLNGDTFTDPLLDEARLIQAADNPLSVPELFPSTNIQIKPVQSDRLLADPSSFDASLNSGALGGPPTGYNELQALGIEFIELNLLLPSLALLQDAWAAEEAALQTQITALTALDAEIDAGQPGKTNIATALADANSALVTVQTLIANNVVPPVGARSAEITARQGEVTTRVTQIRDVGSGDKNFYRDQRYFWVNKRINLRYGSLRTLKQIERNIAQLNEEITELTDELTFWDSIGF